LSIERLEPYAIVGELALENITRSIKGVLSVSVEAAKNTHLRGLLMPRANACEVAVVEGLEMIAVGNLAQSIAFFAGEKSVEPKHNPFDHILEQHPLMEVNVF
jgi:magnesium chelatase family protein